MSKMGDIVIDGEPCEDLLPDIDRHDQNEGQRDLAVRNGGTRAQDDEQEHNAACAQHACRSKQDVHESADEGGDHDHAG